MNESPPPLDPTILEALRREDAAPAAVRARSRERLLSAVAGLQAVGGGPGSGPPRGTALAAKVGALAFLLGGVAGAVLYASLRGEPAPRVVYVDRLVPSSPGAPPILPPVVANPVPAAQAPVVAAEASTARTSGASQLTAERVLLDEARSALAQGDPTRALERLQRHRQSFPTPLLGEERDAMWVSALVKAERYDEARARAEAFRRRFPDSLFASMVDTAIASIP